eukprot:714382-Amphidinium_carterae.1
MRLRSTLLSQVTQVKPDLWSCTFEPSVSANASQCRAKATHAKNAYNGVCVMPDSTPRANTRVQATSQWDTLERHQKLSKCSTACGSRSLAISPMECTALTLQRSL